RGQTLVRWQIPQLNKQLLPNDWMTGHDRLAISPDGKTIACQGVRTISFLSTAGGRVQQVYPVRRPHGRMAFSPDGKFLVTACFSDMGVDEWPAMTAIIQLWSMEPWPHRMLAHFWRDGRLEDVAISPDGKLVAAVGTGIKLWKIAKYK